MPHKHLSHLEPRKVRSNFQNQSDYERYCKERDAMFGLSPQPSSQQAPSLSPTPGKLLSIAEAAKYSGLASKRIRRLVNTEQVRCVRHSKASNSHIFVVRASLDEWIDEQSR